MKKLKYRTSHFEPKQMLINYVQLLFFLKLLLKYYIILIKDGFHTAHVMQGAYTCLLYTSPSPRDS